MKVEDGYHLWSETYERRIGNVLTIQQDIARAVAEKRKLRSATIPQNAIARTLTIGQKRGAN